MALAVPAGNGLNQAGSSAPASSPQPSRQLPDRHVSESNIEHVFVAFILYCNPAVPSDSDTEALREAFRTPPKSGGKSFSTFTLLQLIGQLEAKELKTWAELVTKLGVDPPDQDKGESTQKIQQYAVRLKRWMHALHVDAFFDYLLGNEHTYWTQIPTDPNPVCEDGRDGVAAEDDMALRALLPHIKPKRGRRKPDDDLKKSPAQKARLRSPSFLGHGKSQDPWTAHPDGTRAFVFPPVQSDKQHAMQMPQSAFPWHGDAPMSAFPQSAVTSSSTFWGDPTEPQSAITPSKPRANPRRHGAKVVSSAWRSNLNASSRGRGRPPTSNRNLEPSSAHPDLDRGQANSSPENKLSSQSPPALASVEELSPDAAIPSAELPLTSPATASTPQSARPARPGRLSLQVPERQGGSVRLATPPAPAPPVVITPPPASGTSGKGISHARQRSLQNGMQQQQQQHTPGRPGLGMSPRAQYQTLSSTNGAVRPPPQNSLGPSPNPQYPSASPRNPNNFTSGSTPDRTNSDEVESLLMMRLITAVWLDPEGRAAPAPEDMEEVRALVSAIIDGLRRRAASGEAFLMSLSGLLMGSWAGAGAGHAGLLANNNDNNNNNPGDGASVNDNGAGAPKKKSGLTVQKVEVATDYTRYECRWELRYADVLARFSHDDVIPHSRWKRGYHLNQTPQQQQQQQQDAGAGRRSMSGGSETAGDSEDGSAAAAVVQRYQDDADFWKKRFATLAQTVTAMEQSS